MEYGAADIGIVGKDTIFGRGAQYIRGSRPLDLENAECVSVVRRVQEAFCSIMSRSVLPQSIRVLQEINFYNKKHQTVEIIKLNGSIELAPIVGLSEVICDIVETGTTLKENGLTVLEEVCPLSARVVVNQVSMKMENERITKLIRDLKTVIQ